jgi:leader peptidase (prepilin peptidase) / N-methyltransferase
MQSIFIDIFVFLFGLIAGSFLTCLIYRMELKEEGKDRSPLRGRSFCPKCGHTLAWDDLIPIASYLFLGGKCRYCKQSISLSYPSIEILTAVLFVWIFNFFAQGGLISGWFVLSVLFYFFVSCLLIIIFVFDLKHYIIPDSVTFLGIVVVLMFRIFSVFQNLKFEIQNLGALSDYLIAGLASSLFFFIIFAISKGKWMGFGDVKLAFFMGLLLGYPSIVLALFLAFFIGGIVGISLIIAKKKKLKSEVPFGPFLVAGTFIALLCGEKIISWYLNLFLI